MPPELSIRDDSAVRTAAPAATSLRRERNGGALLLFILIAGAATIVVRSIAICLTDAERQLTGVWSCRFDGTSFHHQFHLRADHSYTETTWSKGEWQEVVSGRWDASDGEIRLYEDWNNSIVEKLEWRLTGRNVAALQIQQQRPDRLILQCRGSSRMEWTRSARGR
jgi:hypothetical protein